MQYAMWAVMVLAGYLAGSVNTAILVTRARGRGDIRTLGNTNPGTANVGRTLGRGWGAVVFFGDVLKALLPMLAARLAFFPGMSPLEILAVSSVGLAAIVGHCRPLYFGFRGGSGAASSLPVVFFFAPAESLVSILAAWLAVLLFVKGVRFRLGRWVPLLFLTLAPFLTLATTFLVNVRLAPWLAIGGHPWAVPVGMFAASFLVLGFSIKTLRQAFTEAGARRRSPPPAG